MIKTYQQSGFTLVECLVAITILLIGVLGPLTIAARGISDGLYARNQITANYLAQEAIESIIWTRNYNFSAARYEYDNSGNPDLTTALAKWANNLKGRTCQNPGNPPCVVDLADDTSGGTIIEAGCPAGDVPSISQMTTGCDLVYQPLSSGGGKGRYVKFSDIGGNPTLGTIFRREVFLKTFPVGSSDPTEIQATVKMTWFNRGAKKEMYLTEHLFPRL